MKMSRWWCFCTFCFAVAADVINNHDHYLKKLKQYDDGLWKMSRWWCFCTFCFAVAADVINNHDHYLKKLKQYDDGLWMMSLDSSYSAEDKVSFIEEEDHLAQVRPLLQLQEQERVQTTDQDSPSLLEVDSSVGKVHAFCEICIMVMQMKMRGQPHLCAGMNPE